MNRGAGDISPRVLSLNECKWKVAPDSCNQGRQLGWYRNPPLSISRPTPVPWIIQDIFNDYHGVAWYWCEFETPSDLSQYTQFILKFFSVDYLAEIWLNEIPVGTHEGSETSFEVDVSEVLHKGGKNLLVVRVLNPTYEPIDGIALKETPSGAKQYPYKSNAVYNSGGITGGVELLFYTDFSIKDIVVEPDWGTGNAKIKITVGNICSGMMPSFLSFKIYDIRLNKLLVSDIYSGKMNPGDNEIEVELRVPDFKLWSPDDPYLYSLTASVQSEKTVNESSVRFGFRDFRFKDGYFRLNGKRIFLKGSNFSTHYPVSFTIPLSEDMFRRDIINMKLLGYNFVRIPFGCPNPRILDLCDELGILVQQEHYGCWQIGQYGKYEFRRVSNMDEVLSSRFENSIVNVIRRDRNHSCLVMWGVLNETFDGIIFRKAVGLLPVLRKLDPTRLFVLNSGRFDGVKEVGSMSNPGSTEWDVGFEELKDWHPYVWIPYSRETLDGLSGWKNSSGQSLYVSETGLCSPIELPSEIGDFQILGKEQSDDACYFKRQFSKFLVDWEKFGMKDCWARPEDYIQEAEKTAASLRETAETAIRSNPDVISYTPTNSVADYSMGESVATNFRRLKPGLLASVLWANTSLRWCLSTEPQSIYTGDSIQLRISFSNLDVLKPGKFPATIQVVGPDLNSVYTRNVFVTVPEKVANGVESPFAWNILAESIVINGPEGKYQLLATLEQGGTALGGKTEFYVSKPIDFAALNSGIVLCGEDKAVQNWLAAHHVKNTPFDKDNESDGKVILVVGEPKDSLTMLGVVRRICEGSVAIFLSPGTFRKGENTTRWLPLAHKGIIEMMDHVEGYYRADRWSKKHPVFDGLPSGGMMDYKFYRNIISKYALSQEYVIPGKAAHTDEEVSAPLTYPSEAVCGATRISHTYCSGIHLGIWDMGQGKFIVNTLNIAENLDRDPAADRLFYNLLRYASENTGNSEVNMR